MIFLLLLIVFVSQSKSTSLPDMASLIANSEFQHRAITSVVWRQADTDSVTDFLANYKGSVETFDMNEKHNRSIVFAQTVLFVTSLEDFDNFVTNMNTNITIPSKVVTVLDANCNLNSITETAWSYDITDLIILTLNENQVEMYTYYPFNNDDCENTTPIKVNFKEDFFTSKFKNLYGCETRVGTVHTPPYSKLKCNNGTAPSLKGLVGVFVSIIMEHMNTTIKVVCVEGSNAGIISLLRNKTCVIHAPSLLHHDYLAVQYAPVFFFFESVWCGPPRREIYAWAKVLIPMMNNITILLAATYFVLVGVLKIISRIENRKSSQIAWNVLAIILGQAADYETKSSLRNYLFALWVWFSMIISIAYQGVLVKGLQSKHLEPRFDSIENAIRLVDGYGGSRRQRVLYNGTPIYDGFTQMRLGEMESYLAPISRGKRFMILTTRLTLLGYNDLQILDKAVNHLPMTMTMTPRWGGGLEVSEAQTRIVEAGFFWKIKRDEELEVERREAMLKSDSSGSQSGHLDFVTLSTCFYGLGVMGFVCFLVLLLEIFHHWLYKPSLRDEFQTRLDKLHAS